MRISDIQRQKKNKKRYSVFIDDKFAFGIEDVDVFNFRLNIGDEISSEKYRVITEQCLYSKARDKALRLLGFKARSEKEIYIRLQEYPDDVIERVLVFLREYGYVNDEEYAKTFARDKFNIKGFGLMRIREELKIKGIKDEIINRVFDGFRNDDEIDERQMAAKLLEKRLGSVTGDIDQKNKNRLYAFLARRGYSCSVIKDAFRQVLREEF